MSAIVSYANRDRALFYEFVDRSLQEYEHWVDQGDGYTPLKALLAPAPTSVGTNAPICPIDTDIKSGVYSRHLNVISISMPSYRETTPNMDGVMHGWAPSYGMLFLSIVTGGHTPILMQCATQLTPLVANVVSTRPNASATRLMDNANFLEFNNCFVIGIDRNSDLDVVAVRYSTMISSRKVLNQQGVSLGQRGFSKLLGNAITTVG